MTSALFRSPSVRTGLFVALATGLYGVSFGALAVKAGFTTWQTSALSLLMFTGGSQFAFVGVVGAGGGPVAATSASVLLGVRNAVYGMRMAPVVQSRGWRRVVAAQVTIDESTATANAQDDPVEQRRGFWSAGLGVFVVWNSSTFVGALAGEALGDPRRWGLDGAAVASFIALLWPRLRTRQAGAIAVASALATLFAVPLVPPGVPVLVAAAVAGLVGSSGRMDADGGRAGVEEPVADPSSRDAS